MSNSVYVNTSTANNKRIAKNTIILYLRMIVTMAIALFTSREVIRILGVEDFGIYNVVAGFVVLLSFLQTGLVSAAQRYLAYDIGKNDLIRVNETFCISFNANILIAILVFIIAETVGLWFVETHLIIPRTRLTSAIYVYHFSVLTFIINILRTSHNSAVIAYERMGFYAFVCILETILKLVIVYLISVGNFDKLWIYLFLLLFVSILISIFYDFFCRNYF